MAVKTPPLSPPLMRMQAIPTRDSSTASARGIPPHRHHFPLNNPPARLCLTIFPTAAPSHHGNCPSRRHPNTVMPTAPSSSDEDCISEQLDASGSSVAPDAQKTALRLSSTTLGSMYAFSPYLAELSFVVCAWSFFLSAENMVTESAVAILQPHTSSPSPRAIARGIGTLITNMSGDDLPKILNAQLDALSIPQQAKQAIIPALLGIARLTEVWLRGTPGSPPRTQIVPNLAEVTVDATPGPGSTVHFQTRQHSFTSSSGSSHTVWYFGKSNRGISSPPVVPQARMGHLYVHFDTSMSAHQYWMLGTNNQWESVSRGAEYPLNHDRVLTIRSNGEPSWVTRASTVTVQTRKERETREKSAP
ncbi:hypothetical protein EDB85DRAFT_1890365 [Lactarius pseudohatsudake]|nr:hypothetical protein EDB85DRAFT_1890365 [Lactarius pseudohatsudake]